jgi:hypothetical protein
MRISLLLCLIWDPTRASAHLTKACSSPRLGRMLFIFCGLLVGGPAGFAGAVTYNNPFEFTAASTNLPGQQVHLSFTPPHGALSLGEYLGQSPSVSNVIFLGHIVVTLQSGEGFVNNYDGGYPLALHFPTGAKAFAAIFSSFLPRPQFSNFPAIVTTDLGDAIHFTAGAIPALVWMGFINTNSFYNVTYSDGGILSPMPYPLHEELIDSIDLVLNPPPNLEASFGPGGRVDVAVNGSRGQTVVVETSTNLVIWQPLSTNTLANDRWVYSEYRSTVDPKRYYRTSLR